MGHGNGIKLKCGRRRENGINFENIITGHTGKAITYLNLRNNKTKIDTIEIIVQYV